MKRGRRRGIESNRTEVSLYNPSPHPQPSRAVAPKLTYLEEVGEERGRKGGKEGREGRRREGREDGKA